MNGVARTARQLTNYARRRGIPILCARPGQAFRHWRDGSVESVELTRGRLAVRIEEDLWQDPAILRHRALLRQRFKEFRPDIVHVTSMGDFGLLGWMLAKEFGIPMVVAWHTNVHEYAAWRFERVAHFLPARARSAIASRIERRALAISMWFYRKGAVGLAPNAELVNLLRAGMGQPVFQMERGVDTVLFNPAKRLRQEGIVVFGYVGRLSPEKNLRTLKVLEDVLESERILDYRIDIVGHGAEAEWLSSNLRRRRLLGVLHGEDLARAYADMDVFVFPSRTDTYGNVVWEAAASGVPAVVTDHGGPKHIVRHGTTGLVCRSANEFVRSCIALLKDSARRHAMGAVARETARSQSWDAVFDRLFGEAYPAALEELGVPGPDSD